MERIDLNGLPSPCYVVDRALIERNLKILDRVQRESGAKILMALKGFAMWRLFPLIDEVLSGGAASSLHEARLAREKLRGQVHLYAPAYRDDEFADLMTMADHVSFNSFCQWRRFRDRVGDRQCAIRINPQHSQVKVTIYDPCAPGSRLGVTAAGFDGQDMTGITGLHFHTLCQARPAALSRTLEAVEQKFGRYLGQMTWINFGGGHHITHRDYDPDALIDLVGQFRKRHGLEVFLEPGEAIALNCGVLVATVLDVVRNDGEIAILDTSASAHMPDVLEMPYRPPVRGAGPPDEKKHTYRLGGLTCLAGDVIGDYSFDQPLRPGQRLVFEDMAHYTMVKNTTFNGLGLPAIAIHDSSTGRTRVVRRFGYEDYKNRLS